MRKKKKKTKSTFMPKKNNLKHEREKWSTGDETHESIEGRTTRHTRIKDSGCSGGSRGRESAKPRRRK